MADSLTDIQISCNQGNAVARQLKQEADRLRKEFNDYHSAVDTVRASWTGANARRYAAKMDEMEGKIQAQVDNLYELAAAVEQTVAIYRERETAAFYKEQADKKSSEHKGSSGATHSGGSHSI